ncbi:wax ester/triacylglycerol synthase family O-acyltransferase [Mycobacterium sp. UM_Kg1]|uniref:wax ester/triacylglycerol synthase family O-acyltransferase n=1 Tax=Mycobacterium sp. UM_Kg1 TaxID=1545691 RepID=UPI00061B28B9|nr:wax ester/triacylglycerol synthase family O-acyltransferase [Mycobacterium sp. UM_Kg1]
MSALDAAMITGNRLLHPINIGAVLIMAPPEDGDAHFVDRLYQGALTATAPVDHRLRRVPDWGLRTGGRWVWRDEHSIDLARHLGRQTLPTCNSRAELWRLIGELHAEPLDRSRPLWSAHLIDGLPDGRLAFYVKADHTMVDGVAGLRMIHDGLTADPAQRDMPPFFAEQHTEAAGAAGHSGLDLLAPLRALIGAFGSAATLLQHLMEGQVRGALATLSGRTTVPAIGAPFTPFNGRLGARRNVIAGSWAKSRIRAVQQATDTTAHEVATAVIGGVLRSWLAQHDSLPGQSLVALCPITVRSAQSGPDDTGNRFGAWLCPIGTNLADPAQRLRLVHRSMREGKRYVARYGPGATLSLLAPSIASTIIQAVAPVGPRVRTGYNLPVSSVPGPREEMYWNGAHVEEIYPVSAIFDGQTLNATVCSYADRVGIGYVADSDVMPDIATLVPRTERCLRELESAVGAGPPGR